MKRETYRCRNQRILNLQSLMLLMIIDDWKQFIYRWYHWCSSRVASPRMVPFRYWIAIMLYSLLIMPCSDQVILLIVLINDGCFNKNDYKFAATYAFIWLFISMSDLVIIHCCWSSIFKTDAFNSTMCVFECRWLWPSVLSKCDIEYMSIWCLFNISTIFVRVVY